MKRWAGLISGIVVGVALAVASLLGLSRLLQDPPAAAGPTQPAAAPSPFALFATQPAAWGQPPLAEPSPGVTATPAPLSSQTPGTLPPRLSLQQPYENLGFDFQSTRLGDGRERWVAASPDGLALVAIEGGDPVEAVSVTVFGSLRPDTPGGPERAVYLLTLLVTVLPGWPDGAAWIGDQLSAGSRPAGVYTAEVVEQGLRVRLAVDSLQGEITLRLEPAR